MSTPLIDLFSDTKTQPGAAMRAAMAAAEVGDERAGEDPTVNALEARGAALLGKEAALYLPSGTMCNEIALAVHCRPGEAVLCEAGAHIVGFEAGGAAALAGVMLEPISGTRGMFTAAQLRAQLRADNLQAPLQRLVAVENTTNLGGGAVWPLQDLREIAACAHDAGLATHMDGARLLNAVVASGVSAADFAQGFDSAWIDFSKGLGAPGGALLTGSKAFVREARRWQLRIGGAMRQSGIIAAACLYALDHNLARLAVDHARARQLAQGVARIPGLGIDVATVQTNLVYFDITAPGWDAAKLAAATLAQGVRLCPMGARRMRAVTHLDVDDAGIVRALEVIAAALRGERRARCAHAGGCCRHPRAVGLDATLPRGLPCFDIPARLAVIPAQAGIQGLQQAVESGEVGVPWPQTRARVAWIFCAKRVMSSRLAATSTCSASISATMACWVARGGRRKLERRGAARRCPRRKRSAHGRMKKRARSRPALRTSRVVAMTPQNFASYSALAKPTVRPSAPTLTIAVMLITLSINCTPCSSQVLHKSW